MKWKYFVLSGVSLGLVVTAYAWAQENPPNTDDLTIKAGYCLGVRQAWLQYDLTCIQAHDKVLATSSASMTFYESKCQNRRADISRLSDFLFANGYSSTSEKHMAIDKEVNRGTTDFNDCVFHADISDYMACKEKCESSSSQSDTCIQHCPKPVSCQKTDACLSLDFLPASK